ncbi:MAG: hypothetical protein GTN76_13660, partial [Candidatus Aenigmarchaeota archaeon]|nr:hypothetical protein [Candidatus Aenigmarchaeota archaeon]
MKKICLILILIFIALNISVAYKHSEKGPLQQKARENEIKDWENPAMIGRNKEPAHCTYIPYADTETALKNNPSQSPYYLSLNGTWKFN